MYSIPIGGLQPFTTIDFPDRLAAVIFLRGCNLRCTYCHNPELLEPQMGRRADWESIFTFLHQRRGLLDGVVLSGGEPTLYPHLGDAAEEIQRMGFEIALHTNGCFPHHLETMLDRRLLSYVAMDVKAPFDEYQVVTRKGEGLQAAESARLITESGIDHEFRTTVHPHLLDDEAILKIAHRLGTLGTDRFILQEFKPGKTLNPDLPIPLPGIRLGRRTLRRLQEMFTRFALRGALLES